jgi:hypothetical protein
MGLYVVICEYIDGSKDEYRTWARNKNNAKNKIRKDFGNSRIKKYLVRRIR